MSRVGEAEGGRSTSVASPVPDSPDAQRASVPPSRPGLALLGALSLLGYSGLLYWASSRPAQPGTLELFPHADKVVHAGAYGVWGLLAFATLQALAWPLWRPGRAVLAVLAAVVYGTTDEVHQAFVPARSADGWDLVADASGAALSVALVAWFLQIRQGNR